MILNFALMIIMLRIGVEGTTLCYQLWCRGPVQRDGRLGPARHREGEREREEAEDNCLTIVGM